MRGLHQFALKIQERFFYGWVVAGVAALGMFASGPGQSHIFSVFNGLIAADLNLSASSVSTAYGLATLVAAFGLPYVGQLVDKFGPRRVLLVVIFGLGLSCMAFSQVAGVLSLGLGFAALRFLGQGSLMLGCNNVVAQWFNARRGFALSLVALGFALSVAIHPPLAQWFVSLGGWREAWIWLGLMTWALMIPAIYFFVHDRPEQLGLEPDGVQKNPTNVQADSAEQGMTRAQAIRTSAFWIIASGLFAMSMLVTSLFFHQVVMLEHKNFSAQFAASLFALTSIVMAIGIPTFGRVLDRVRTQTSFAVSLCLLSAALTSMAFVSGYASAIAYAVVFGVCVAGVQAHYSYLWPRFFGRKHLGAIQGLGQTIGVVGASLGPLPLAVAFDVWGDFDAMLIGLAVIPLVCAVAAYRLVPPKLPTSP